MWKVRHEASLVRLVGWMDWKRVREIRIDTHKRCLTKKTDKWYELLELIVATKSLKN